MLCPSCGPVPIGPPCPNPDTLKGDADLDALMEELGPDGFARFLRRLEQ
jgi:hypothetical protein